MTFTMEMYDVFKMLKTKKQLEYNIFQNKIQPMSLIFPKIS